MAALFAAPSGELGARIGQRPVATVGGLVFAGGFAFMLRDGRPETRIRDAPSCPPSCSAASGSA